MKRSRNGRRRAIVLMLVHVIFAVHIAQWLLSGLRTGERSTISPIEPSEAMYTLEQGQINAGFVFFILAIAATLVFGRYFCGWGCHVVALQDMCAWMMRKAHMRPKPFRTRLLVWAPLGLGLYMFVWPTFHREVITRAFDAVAAEMPAWLGRSAPFPGFQPHFVVEDFWATFPPWYVAIPFLFICGFAVVYFLGSKGFCTYGCPYGGFFAVADRFSPGRIVVDEKCHQCGHCTAACTSNVRVHEEVRDYGMVVDPGCMKCMDCVSVCPNEALSFSFARPPAVVKPRDAAAADRVRARATRSHAYDLSWREEVVCAVLFVAYIQAFRGMLGLVPLLMAAGMAAIATYGTFKLWSLLRLPNVRVQNLQIRHRGRLTRSGWVFAPLMVIVAASAVWSGAVRLNVWLANMLDARIETPIEVVFAPNYEPDPKTRRNAQRASTHFRLAQPPAMGGFGWGLDADTTVRAAWVEAVMGRLHRAEDLLLRAVMSKRPSETMVDNLSHVMAARGASPAEFREMLEKVHARHPGIPGVMLALVQADLQARERDRPRVLLAEVVNLRRIEPRHLLWAADLLFATGRTDAAVEALERAAAMRRDDASLRATLGMGYAQVGRSDEALREVAEAVRLSPQDPNLAQMHAALLRSLGKTAEAEREAARAAELRSRVVPGSGGEGR